jgi:predicted nucleic acid-binding protein
MGLLTLPQGSLVFIDANVVIYSAEKIEPYRSLLQPMWEAAKAGEIALIGSELLLLETLVKPLHDQDVQLESIFRNLLLASNELRLIPIDRLVLESAARLRATVGIKTPDAIRAATALLAGTTLFVTNDLTLRRVPGLSVTVLDEVIAGP